MVMIKVAKGSQNSVYSLHTDGLFDPYLDRQRANQERRERKERKKRTHLISFAYSLCEGFIILTFVTSLKYTC
jgi:hypothetical protein